MLRRYVTVWALRAAERRCSGVNDETTPLPSISPNFATKFLRSLPTLPDKGCRIEQRRSMMLVTAVPLFLLLPQDNRCRIGQCSVLDKSARAIQDPSPSLTTTLVHPMTIRLTHSGISSCCRRRDAVATSAYPVDERSG